MNSTLPTPFAKSRLVSVVDTTKNKSRFTAAWVTKRRTFFVFPAFSLANTWRGASEIIAKFNITGTGSLSLIEAFQNDFTGNFCPVIAWRTGPTEITRFKLVEDVGEYLYLDLYDGETVPANFSIEIWNTNHNPITLLDPIEIFTSILVNPTRFCDDDDIEVTYPIRQCLDLTFDLTDFDPLNGDYYISVGDCGQTTLIKGVPFQADYLLLKSSDNTWHKYYPTTIDSIVRGDVNPNNEAPGVLGFLPMVYGANVYSFALINIDGSNYPYITGPIGVVPDYVGFYAGALLKNPVDGLTYRLMLSTVDGNLRENFLST